MKRLPALCLILAAVASGCMTTGAPRGWLSTPEEAQSEAYGGWAMIEYRLDGVEQHLNGELLAVEGDSIHVHHQSRWTAVSRTDITSGRVAVYDPQSGQIAVWNTLGTLSTLSHGVLLILSAPVWLTSSPITFNAPVRRARPSVGPGEWDRVAVHARFPGGIPEGIDRVTLQPKHAGY